MSEIKKVVYILEKAWEFKCPPSEYAALQTAALYLDNKMRTLQQKGKSLAYEHLTLLAAVSLTHELLAEKKKTQMLKEIRKKVDLIKSKLEHQLIQFEKLSI